MPSTPATRRLVKPISGSVTAAMLRIPASSMHNTVLPTASWVWPPTSLRCRSNGYSMPVNMACTATPTVKVSY